MQVPGPAKLSLLLLLAGLLLLTSVPARAQTDQPDTDAVRAGVQEIFSMMMLGAVSTQDQVVEVTRTGSDYHVRLPLKAFTAPPGAALEGVVRPLAGGVWDVASLTFPSAGTIEPPGPKEGIKQMQYSIGEQSIHARVDPGFLYPSTVAADFRTIRLRSDQGVVHSEQDLGRYVIDANVSAETAGRIDFASHAKLTDWHILAHAPNGFDADGLARSLSANAAAEGLDRVQGQRLLTATRAFLAAARPEPLEASLPGTHTPPPPRAMSPGARQTLRTIVDTIPGLLTRFNVEESADGIRFTGATATGGAPTGGTIERVRLAMAGESVQERINAHMDIGLDELRMASLPADTAAYLPHHVEIRSVMAGVPTGALTALMHAATEPDADFAALLPQVAALFGNPDARIGIQSFSFDSGPLRMTGWVHFVQRAGGAIGTDVHVAATGMDAFMAGAQGNPALQQVQPMLFMAKGMGRPDGQGMTWDISVGGGPMTVNGTPFGQPPARTR